MTLTVANAIRMLFWRRYNNQTSLFGNNVYKPKLQDYCITNQYFSHNAIPQKHQYSELSWAVRTQKSHQKKSIQSTPMTVIPAPGFCRRCEEPGEGYGRRCCRSSWLLRGMLAVCLVLSICSRSFPATTAKTAATLDRSLHFQCLCPQPAVCASRLLCSSRIQLHSISETVSHLSYSILVQEIKIQP